MKYLVAVLLLVGACAYKVPGPTSTTQGNLVVTDSLRVGTSATSRDATISGAVIAWGKGVFDDSLRVGNSTQAAPAVISGSLDIWGTTTFHGSTNLGGGALTGSATLDFDLTSVSYQDLTMTVSTAVAGTPVALGVPNGSVTAGILYFAWVSAANTVTVRAMRTCDTTPNPASGTFKVTIQ
jgi:hypothetical protein